MSKAIHADPGLTAGAQQSSRRKTSDVHRLSRQPSVHADTTSHRRQTAGVVSDDVEGGPSQSQPPTAVTSADASDLDLFLGGPEVRLTSAEAGISVRNQKTTEAQELTEDEASDLLSQMFASGPESDPGDMIVVVSRTPATVKRPDHESAPIASTTQHGLSTDTVTDADDVVLLAAPVTNARPPQQSAPVGQKSVLPEGADTSVPQYVPTPVPVPQFVPLPIFDPGLTPRENNTTGHPSAKHEPLPGTRRPDPDRTGPVNVAGEEADVELVEQRGSARSATVDSLPDAAAASEDSTPEDSTPEEITRRQKRDVALRRFRKLVELAKSELLKKQEPIPQTRPRRLSKNIAQLESIRQDKVDDIVVQLRLISETRSPFAIEPLRDFAQRRHPRIRQVCAEGLGNINHATSGIALLDLLSDRAPEVVDAAVRSLLRSGDAETISLLIALACADARYRSVMREAVSLLDDAAQEKLVEPLQAVLKAGDTPESAAFALNVLSVIRGTELLKTYIGLTKHAAPELRVAAIEALVQTKQNQVVRFLNSAMKDRNARVRSAAATGMAGIRSPKSLSLLVIALADRDVSVRRSAAMTLTSLDGPEIAAAAAKALNAETDPAVVESLLEIIGKGGADDALTTLQRFLDSNDLQLRHRAIATLRRLKNPQGAELLTPFLQDANPESRRLAVEAVGHLDNRCSVPRLQELLKTDSNEPIRAAAARSLGELRDEKSVGQLEEALHDSRLVRCQAVIALGNIGSKRSIPAVLAQLRDAAAEVRYHACVALAEFGELPNPEPLLNLLDDSEAMVRRGAEAALTKLGCKVGGAKFSKRFTKLTSALVPSVVAGMLPGGAAVLMFVAVTAVLGISWVTWNKIGVSAELDFPISNIRAIAVSNNGSQLSIARKFNVLEVWNVFDGLRTAQFKADSGGDGIIYKPDGNALILAGSQSFELNSTDVTSNGKESLQPAGLANVSSHRVAMTPDRKKAVLCAISGHAALVDLVSGKQILTFQIKEFSEQDAITINPDVTLAFVGTSSGELKVFSLEEGKLLGRLDIGQLIGSPSVAVTALAMDHTGAFIAIGTSSGNVVVVDANELEVSGKPYSGKGRIVGLTFMRGSSRLGLVTSQRELATCSADFSSSRPLRTRPSDAPERVAFSVDGTIAAFAYSDSDAFCVVDLSGDRMLTEYPPKN